MTGTTCRLPSEAEWEYACRARTTKAYAVPAATGGSDDIAGKALANCAGCGSQWDGKQTAPVGQFRPNRWDLYDMHGNVWEWVEDCWHEDYGGAPENGQAWLEGNGGNCRPRVLRGGSWHGDPGLARCALRLKLGPDFQGDFIGFRVMCLSPI